MIKLALTLPGSSPIPTNLAGTKTTFINLSSVMTELFNVAIYLAGFLAFFWLFWASFQYILARGDKEKIAKAREKIWWAIIGMFVVFLAYFFAGYVAQIFGPNSGSKDLPFMVPRQ